MELPWEHIPASVTVMNVRPGCFNVQPLWAIVSCPRVQPSAQLSTGLLQRAYFPWILHRAGSPGAAESGDASLRPAARAHGCSCLLKRFCVMSCLPILAFVLLLPGCASHLAPPEPTRDDVLIHVHLVDHIDYQPGAEAFGLSRCANGVCVLHVLRERYPFCLLHALRHAFEGDWHPGRETLDDC